MKLAAVAYDVGEADAVDALLRQVAHALRGEGRKLAGTVQWNEARPNTHKKAMVLENLASGQRLDISADASPDPAACRMNSYALEGVAGLVAGTITPGLDLVILNRFGKQEAARGGFMAVIEAAIVNDLPVLTGLNRAHLGHWREFTSGEAVLLAPDAGEVRAWIDAALNSPGGDPS